MPEIDMSKCCEKTKLVLQLHAKNKNKKQPSCLKFGEFIERRKTIVMAIKLDKKNFLVINKLKLLLLSPFAFLVGDIFLLLYL